MFKNFVILHFVVYIGNVLLKILSAYYGLQPPYSGRKWSVPVIIGLINHTVIKQVNFTQATKNRCILRVSLHIQYTQLLSILCVGLNVRL